MSKKISGFHNGYHVAKKLNKLYFFQLSFGKINNQQQ